MKLDKTTCRYYERERERKERVLDWASRHKECSYSLVQGEPDILGPFIHKRRSHKFVLDKFLSRYMLQCMNTNYNA